MEVFTQELRYVIEWAHREGVNVESFWECRSDDDAPDWEVEIVRVNQQ